MCKEAQKILNSQKNIEDLSHDFKTCYNTIIIQNEI